MQLFTIMPSPHMRFNRSVRVAPWLFVHLTVCLPVLCLPVTQQNFYMVDIHYKFYCGRPIHLVMTILTDHPSFEARTVRILYTKCTITDKQW